MSGLIMTETIDIADRLRTLVAMGYQFAHHRDSAGGVVALTGVRVHDRVIDIVQLYGEHDADAVRIPGDEPDILFPRTVLWRTSGRASEVIDAVLALSDTEPAPPARKGIDAPGGCWVPTRPGRRTWLAASA